MWKHRLRVRFSGMDPHVGQTLTLYVRNLEAGAYLDTVVIASIEEADFDVESHVVEPGESYMVDFYADHNGNGIYDAPPADHAWRLESGTAMGDLDLDFTHNTEFTDIFGTTGLHPGRGSFLLQVYPNPATDVLHIIAEEPVASVSLYSLTGSHVITLKGRSASQAISLEGIVSGIYFVKVTMADMRTAVTRFIKQ